MSPLLRNISRWRLRVQNFWATCANVLSLLTVKNVSQCSEGAFCVLVCASCLLSCHWTPLKRAWLYLFCTLPSGICIHWWDAPEPSVQAEQSITTLFSQWKRCSSSLTIFKALCWNLSSWSLILETRSGHTNAIETWTRCITNKGFPFYVGWNIFIFTEHLNQ